MHMVRPDGHGIRSPGAYVAVMPQFARPARGVVIGLALVTPFWAFVSMVGWNLLH